MASVPNERSREPLEDITNARRIVGSIEAAAAWFPDEHLRRTGVFLEPAAVVVVMKHALALSSAHTV